MKIFANGLYATKPYQAARAGDLARIRVCSASAKKAAAAACFLLMLSVKNDEISDFFLKLIFPANFFLNPPESASILQKSRIRLRFPRHFLSSQVKCPPTPTKKDKDLRADRT
jgi:hypothetical protein